MFQETEVLTKTSSSVCQLVKAVTEVILYPNSTVMYDVCDCRWGLVNLFIDHLYTPLRITSNYSAIAPVSTIYKSPQHPPSLFPACCVFTSRSLATASNSGDSSASHAQVLSSQPPMQNSTLSFVPYNISMDHTENTTLLLSCATVALSRICCVAMGMCLLSLCSEAGAVYRVTE
jgi:hypothetical protein